MKRLKKKGFTLTELVVVIVIIGILIAVLIPLLTSYIQKAKESNDTELITNLNTALSTDAAYYGKHESMTDALKAASEFGYDVEKINASKTNNEILWDSYNDVFCYYDQAKNQIIYTSKSVSDSNKLDVTDYRLWVISDQIHANWSTYYTGAPDNTDLMHLNKGFDAGNVEGITSLLYKRSETATPQTVVIRTNSYSTDLEVDAPTDTVKHIGRAGHVTLTRVASTSYHEKGEVAFIEISNGRLAIEANSTIDQIHLNAKDDDKFGDIIIAVDYSIDLDDIELTRDEITIADGGTLVVALQIGTGDVVPEDLDYVWLTKQGIYEQITISDNKETSTVRVAEEDVSVWVDSTQVPTIVQQAALKIANNVFGQTYVSEVAPVEINTFTFDVSIDPTTRDIILTEQTSSEMVFKVVNDNGETKITQNNVVVELDETFANVLENAITDCGLDADQKDSIYDTVVTPKVNQELIEKGQEVTCVHHYDNEHFNPIPGQEPTCLEVGKGYRVCTLCGAEDHSRIVEIPALGHDLIGTFCNVCGHPVAFVDQIDDFTPNQANMEFPELMPTILNILASDDWSFSGSAFDAFLDVAYQFSAFSEDNAQFNDTIRYNLDLEALADGNFKFIEDENGTFTASDIFNFFGGWVCDFYVSFDEDVDAYSCGLGGNYSGMSVGFMIPDINGNGVVNGGVEIPLLETIIKVVMGEEAALNFYWVYSGVADLVRDFKCGFFNLSKFNVGKTFTVNLRMVNPDVINYHNDIYTQATYSSELNGVPIELPAYIDIATIKYDIVDVSDANKAKIASISDENIAQILMSTPEMSRLFGELMPTDQLLAWLSADEGANMEFLLFLADYLDNADESHRALVSQFATGLLQQLIANTAVTYDDNSNPISPVMDPQELAAMVSYAPYIRDCLSFMDQVGIDNVFASLETLIGRCPKLSTLLGELMSQADLFTWLNTDDNAQYTLFLAKYLDPAKETHQLFVQAYLQSLLGQLATEATNNATMAVIFENFLESYSKYLINCLDFIGPEMFSQMLVGNNDLFAITNYMKTANLSHRAKITTFVDALIGHILAGVSQEQYQSTLETFMGANSDYVTRWKNFYDESSETALYAHYPFLEGLF